MLSKLAEIFSVVCFLITYNCLWFNSL